MPHRVVSRRSGRGRTLRADAGATQISATDFIPTNFCGICCSKITLRASSFAASGKPRASDRAVERVRSLAVLLIVTFRPEFRSPWTGQPQVSMLTLNRLDRRDRTALVAQIAGGKVLSDEVVAQIVDRTDGVPLFVEELTKSVLESGVSLVGIPTTLHDSLMARLDRLASVRLVAQIGAAIGREFSYQLLHAVSRLPDDELQAALARLVASELVFQRGRPPDASIASSTRWCRTRHTAAYCAPLASDCTHRSQSRSKPILLS